MKLEEIGFYTLSDARASTASYDTDLWRCELILTDLCNFRCGYCRPLREDCQGSLTWSDAAMVVREWAKHGIRNIRFSGGEPTLWPHLRQLVSLTKDYGTERIAVSTNGSAPARLYRDLISSGVDDFSVSLDACCASTGARMCGRSGMWEIVTENIKWIAKETYVTVGIVLTDTNIVETYQIIELAQDLGVSDIRIIPAAQYNNKLGYFTFNGNGERKYPILKYRMDNLRVGKPVRGLCSTDNNRCPLVLDDMAVASGKHFPCIIYLREQGEPIGEFTDIGVIREQRRQWGEGHDTHKDPICAKNCLDVCVAYNNKHQGLKTRSCFGSSAR